jgi:hypothetical protein
MTFIFIAQIIIGLLLYGRGWWHGAFSSGTEEAPNTRELFTVIRGYEINVTSIGNIVIGLALVIIGIVGLVLL